eukprot:2116699-Pyramimonas_sp.AAC.1
MRIYLRFMRLIDPSFVPQPFGSTTSNRSEPFEASSWHLRVCKPFRRVFKTLNLAVCSNYVLTIHHRRLVPVKHILLLFVSTALGARTPERRG